MASNASPFVIGEKGDYLETIEKKLAESCIYSHSLGDC